MPDRDDIDSLTGLPDDLGIGADLGRAEQHLTVRRESRRYGKPVTIVEGFDTDVTDVDEVASAVKRKLACGGTVEDGAIELQGDHVRRVVDVLRDLGYVVEA